MTGTTYLKQGLSGMWLCDECGCVVGDRETHDRWHQSRDNRGQPSRRVLNALRAVREQHRFNRMPDAEKIERGFGPQWLRDPTLHPNYDPADFDGQGDDRAE